MTSARLFLVFATLLLGHASNSFAQNDEPIGRFVVDVRGSLVPFGKNEQLATARQLDPFVTPNLGLGFEAGAHVYVFSWRMITVGLGANIHGSLGDRHPAETDPDPDGQTIRKKLTAVSPQLSFNFGGRNGWSYLSGGLGTSRLSLYSLDQTEPSQRRTRTLNYGGGARWFVKEHLAFSLDLRFYASKSLKQIGTATGSPRMTTMALSIGASFK